MNTKNKSLFLISAVVGAVLFTAIISLFLNWSGSYIFDFITSFGVEAKIIFAVSVLSVIAQAAISLKLSKHMVSKITVGAVNVTMIAIAMFHPMVMVGAAIWIVSIPFCGSVFKYNDERVKDVLGE